MKNVLLVVFLLLVGKANAMPFPPLGTPVTGTFTVCAGQTTTLANSTPGGTWSSTDLAVATVDGTTGVVTGVAAGTATISYVMGGDFAIQVVTVNTAPSAIVGSDAFCNLSSATYTSSPAGGTWTSVNASIITIDPMTGVAVGISTDHTDIIYTLPNTCSVSKDVAVILAPYAITAPGGSHDVCVSGSKPLSNPIGGGVWSSSSPGIASVIASTGVVTGAGAGVATITYTLSSGCWSTFDVTVNAMPGAITGTTVVCETATTTLSNATPGGTWDAGLPSVASVDVSTGVVTGVSGGVAPISYNAGGCTVTTLVTVNALPNAGGIAGSSDVCVGDTVWLSDAISGGTWSSSNTVIATVGTDGIVSGVSTGVVVISYTVSNSCGPASATLNVTVNTLPDAGTITGTPSVCAGGTRTLTNAVTGGVWTSSNNSLATVGTSGIVSGVSMGIDTISYTTTNGCGSSVAAIELSVNPVPAAIVGGPVVCRSFSATLTNDTTGGTWSSSNSNVSVGSLTGIATGINTGTATISYSLPTGCRSTKVITVNIAPKVITGSRNICEGLTVTLTDTVTGGTWSSPDANISVGSASGVVSGITPGTATVSYSISNGCTVTAVVTVNVSPGPITGPTSVCAISTITLSNSVAGGTWSSLNIAARVGTLTGIVQGMGPGTATIVYKMPGNCISTTTVTILTAPAAVTGTATLCEGATTTLSDVTYAGLWISSNTSVATVVTPSGVVAGVSAGTAVISYALANGCYKTKTVTVNPLPGVLTGPGEVCTGSAITLATTSTAGTWTTANTNISVAPGGIVTGISAGAAVVTYLFPATGCRRTTGVVVNPVPSAIAGIPAVCAGGATTLLSSTPITGSWSSTNTSVADVASVAGLVTGVAAGTATISYVMPATGCYRAITVTVNALPAPISGSGSVCEGDTVMLSSTPTGGTWISGSIGNATAGATTGIITGIAQGSANITYIVPTGCFRSMTMTVNALPFAGLVAGAHYVCESAMVTLAGTVAGGTWSTTTGNASATGTSGIVSGISGGLDTIVYTVTGVCGTSSVTHPVTVNPLPEIGVISGAGHICIGQTTTLSKTVVGGAWTSSSSATATVSPTGDVTAVAAGTATISYTRTNSCGPKSATLNVTVHTLANSGTVSGIDSFCIGDTSTIVAAIAGGTWSSATPWLVTIQAVTGKAKGQFPGTADILYIVTNACSADTTHHTLVVKTQLECETSVQPVANMASATLQLFPNPTGGAITVQSPAAGTLSIYTIDGRMIMKYPVMQATTRLSLPADAIAGMYMCRFVGDDGSNSVIRLEVLR